ncbi:MULTISPECIES: uracil phosphoribosyltransferase [Anaerofustis]|uniref:uracil phosphoribosyltransferase n=1 Tax=Anaerofustis TaxID=264995 RepID=UPI001106F402|nr:MULTISPECIES: uracil phosphoribosyltransferase [Anaerofustis]MCO8193691.1 uracil phosphoribosyltransferase [Anaerofustis sp. NSJ-163]
MSQVIILDHPIIKDYVSTLRDEKTNIKDFRETVKKLSLFIGYEAVRNVETKKEKIKTPLCETTGEKIINDNITVIPILRAGLGMMDGMLELLPNAKVGHIGLERNERTLKAEEYYFKMPNNYETMDAYVVDPMLATGGSAVDAIDKLKERGIKHIKFLCIISSPEGIEKLQKEHPDVDIYTAVIDECLNEHGYILPGLGDAGDRIFGTI